MTQRNLDIKAGELVVFSEGEYSDYGYGGSFVMLQDISQEEMLRIAAETNAAADADDDNYFNRSGMFVAALIRGGYLASINLREIHLGSYGRLEL